MPIESAAVAAYRYILFYKPYNVLCDFDDPEGRPAVGAYVPMPDVYAAGRLDQDSEGLLLLTNDGRLAHRLTHPRHHQPKTYLVQVEGVPGATALAALRRGVVVKGQMTAPAQVEPLSTRPDIPPRPIPVVERPNVSTTWLRLVLREGRKREIRHMTAAVGHPTLRLVRIAIGPLTLGVLQPGQWRELTRAELDALRRSA
jgi:23S rRNA pseudouridine2457 synthase